MNLRDAYVILDAGHHFRDSGALSIALESGDPMQENKINMNVARFTKNELVTMGVPKVDITHYMDTNVVPLSVNDRGVVISNAKPHLYLSIHHNAGGGNYGLVCVQDNPRSLKFGEFLKAEWEKLRPNVQIKQMERQLGMLRLPAYHNVVGILGEFCFIDTKDVNRIDTTIEQKAQGKANAKAIVKMLLSL